MGFKNYPRISEIFKCMEFQDENFGSLPKDFESCEHPLSGRHLVIGTLGENPNVLHHRNRSIYKDKNGVLMGTNQKVIYILAKKFGFTFTEKYSRTMMIYNATSGTWIGFVEDVSF